MPNRRKRLNTKRMLFEEPKNFRLAEAKQARCPVLLDFSAAPM